jgi:hypothetical protein
MHVCTTTLEIRIYGTIVGVIDEYCQLGKNIAIEYEQSSSHETLNEPLRVDIEKTPNKFAKGFSGMC